MIGCVICAKHGEEWLRVLLGCFLHPKQKSWPNITVEVICFEAMRTAVSMAKGVAKSAYRGPVDSVWARALSLFHSSGTNSGWSWLYTFSLPSLGQSGGPSLPPWEWMVSWWGTSHQLHQPGSAVFPKIHPKNSPHIIIQSFLPCATKSLETETCVYCFIFFLPDFVPSPGHLQGHSLWDPITLFLNSLFKELFWIPSVHQIKFKQFKLCSLHWDHFCHFNKMYYNEKYSWTLWKT